MKLIESPFLIESERVCALGSLLAIRSTWIEFHAVPREPKLACGDSDPVERHAKL
jgi:hypothetical protein